MGAFIDGLGFAAVPAIRARLGGTMPTGPAEAP